MHFLTFLILAFTLTRGESAVYPRVKGTPTVVGILEDVALNRDSCGSTLIGNRSLWVCRDTNDPTSENGLPIICNTASWTDLPSRGGGTSLRMYGDNKWRAFYPLVPGYCDDNDAGACPDGTRYPHWQDSPPLITYDDGQVAIGYTFMPNWHIIGLEQIVKNPSTSLYRVTHRYDADHEALPKAELVDPLFWAEGEIPFGVYGTLVRNGMAYLWAKDSDWRVTLARVPASKIEDKGSYEYYVGGQWTTRRPALGDPAATIEHGSAGGQGTYYWSEHWQSYVWIGQAIFSVSADFFITTAPQPEGPWIPAEHFYKGQDGTAPLPSYTIQAHPGLSNPDVNEIYVTYTKVDELYTTPLIRVEWE